MGQGMIIITPEPKEVIEVARTHNIESKVIGKVTSRGEIRIESRGLNSSRTGELIY
jgi:phosphoribosylaminoimidazole (AIR) synthetase|tara:strand:- start:5868 stop:6035 length:168 start_codon:yes stop_codon:yes gene_type:complete